MVRNYEAEALFGVELEETPQTLAYGLSGNFGSQIMDELARRGLTLGELAKRMGIKQPTLCGMLRGNSNMTLKTMARMALALDCALEAPKLVRDDKPARLKSTNVVPFDALNEKQAGSQKNSEALQA